MMKFDYTPPFELTADILNRVSSISEKLGEINVYHNLDSKPHLRRNNKIKSIQSSLAIEANSLSVDEVRDVINGHTVLGPEREITEVRNAYEAYENILSFNPYSLNDLKKAHRTLTKNLISDAGKFRKGNEGVFDGDKVIFIAPPPDNVEPLMTALFEWMKGNRNGINPLVLSSVFHYEFVFIHPFSDGNGRTARLWQNVILSNWKEIFQFVPIETEIGKRQNDYYKAISDSHISGKSNAFIDFMLECIDVAVDQVFKQARSNDDAYSEYVRKLLDVMEFDVSYTCKDLMNRLGLKSKETFRKNYLHPAISLNLITMTIPDKPQSRNQRYVKK